MEENNKERSYCRKCAKLLPVKNFYEATDLDIDTNGIQSVCKNCIQDLYDMYFKDMQSMEKAIHKLCISLNIKFSNEAVNATKAHINTLLEGGKNVNFTFGIYKAKLIATNPSMDKSTKQNLTYEDVGTIYTEKQENTDSIPIPDSLKEKWESAKSKADIEYLEREYVKFSETYKIEDYTQVTLLKHVCYTLLNIKKLLETRDDPKDDYARLNTLMNSLAIAPSAKNKKNTDNEKETLGLWIKDIEEFEPAEWLRSDPRGDIYRDVANTDEYFEKFTTRPLRNYILGSRDFNVDESALDNDVELTAEDITTINDIDDGLTEEK